MINDNKPQGYLVLTVELKSENFGSGVINNNLATIMLCALHKPIHKAIMNGASESGISSLEKSADDMTAKVDVLDDRARIEYHIPVYDGSPENAMNRIMVNVHGYVYGMGHFAPKDITLEKKATVSDDGLRPPKEFYLNQ